jgi:hypothetical protein
VNYNLYGVEGSFDFRVENYTTKGLMCSWVLAFLGRVMGSFLSGLGYKGSFQCYLYILFLV